MKEDDIKKATGMIERRNNIIHQIGKLQDCKAVVATKGRKIAAQLHFSSDSIHIGLTRKILDLIVQDMRDQAEYINNQLKSMGITTLDEEMDAAAEVLAKRTSVPVTKPVLVPSVFVDQEDRFTPKMPGQSGITTGKEAPRHPDDDFGGEV